MVAWYRCAMSLSPQVRRERRAQAAKYREAKKIPRRRCLNCNGWFLKTRKNKKFCKPECQQEYNRYGSAFGPLKDYLTKLIATASKEEAAMQFAGYVAGKTFRRQIAAAGFIHRSMVKPKPPELTPEGLAGACEMLSRLIGEIAVRVTRLEQAQAAYSPGQGYTTAENLTAQLAGVTAMREAAQRAGVKLGTNPEPQSAEPQRRRRPRS